MQLFNSLHMASQALNISQLGIQVAGQNLNNINTPGYTRSVMQLTTDSARKLGNGTIVGTGAHVAGVVQVIDQFLEERLRSATGDTAASATQQKFFSQLETLLNETTDKDLSTSILAFFNSIDSVLNHPEDVNYRQMTVDQGTKLVNDINGLADSVIDMQIDINKQIETSAEDINRFLKEIEDLNKNITLMESKHGSNDSDAIGLRDQRNNALTNLANLLSIKTSEDPKTGQLTVYSGSNILLSTGYRAEVKVGYDTASEDDEVTMAQLCIGKEMTPLDVKGGYVLGLYQSHQVVLGGYLNKLDVFAGQLVTEFNKIYTSGQGLTGYDHLASLFHVEDASIPLGSASLEVPITNGGFAVQVYNTETKVTTEHYIEINVQESKPSDPFSLKMPSASGGTTFQDIADSINAIDGLTASINTYGELEIQAEKGSVEFAFAKDTSGVLSALGLNTFFTGTRAGALGVNPALVSDPSKFAASQSGIGSDTEIGVSLAVLAITPNSVLGGETLSSRYGGIVSETMMAGATTKAIASANTMYQESLQAQRDAISGVNTDEESIMMMTYQRMFQANSRLVTTIDEMMTVLLTM